MYLSVGSLVEKNAGFRVNHFFFWWSKYALEFADFQG